MHRLRFTKMHGLGNDFLVVRSARGILTAAAAARLCDRRRGVGADGVLTVLPPRSPRAAHRMHVRNSDGSEARMCGNGLRCVVRAVLEGVEAREVVIDTDAGDRAGAVLEDGRVRVGLGEASLLAEGVDAEGDGARFRGTAVSLGNPHLVLDPFPAGTDLRALAARHGPALERHPAFLDGVNVGFAAARGPAALDLVVFERGAGITDACGTGAAAAAAVAALRGLVAAPGSVEVRLPGGPLTVVLDGARGARPSLGAVALVGDAVVVFDGEVDVEDPDLEPGGGAS